MKKKKTPAARTLANIFLKVVKKRFWLGKFLRYNLYLFLLANARAAGAFFSFMGCVFCGGNTFFIILSVCLIFFHKMRF